MSDTPAPTPVVPTEEHAADKQAHANVCGICGIPELPCPRCTPQPKILPEKGSFPTRQPGVSVR